MDLGIDNDELAACVGCGLCLPHCPTYRVTGEELASPRGRIALMREVQWGDSAADATFLESMDSCVQCRGCETACPSGVHYGHLMEATRATLVSAKKSVPWWQRLGYRALGHHRLLLMGSSAIAVAQRLHLVPNRAGLPKLDLRRASLTGRLAEMSTQRRGSEPVWMFTGCVMDAWQRDVHIDTLEVLAEAGADVRLPGSGGACCGALHTHAGLNDQATALASAVMASMPGDAPIVVNSAGCGAALVDYGHLLGTAEAKAFSARVVDVHTWLADRIDRLPAAIADDRITLAVQDPCHLRHVQKAHLPVRAVLAPFADLIELDDEGLCCGAGGAYSALHPDLAEPIRARKVASITRSGAGLVASANPGCSMHLAAAGVATVHPMTVVARALRKGTRAPVTAKH
ncbi:MAG: (Fe-S)-binding protein [Acidimicrobiia bacterium]